MNVTELLQNRNKLHIKFSIPGVIQVCVSPEYAICGLVLIRTKSYYTNSLGPHTWPHTIMIELKKLFESDNLMYSINFTSEALDKNKTYLCSETNDWQVYEIYAGNFKSEVVMDLTLDISSNTGGLFSSLRDDSNLTDFELNGDDGSVKVHKTILAGLSPFVKTMLDNSGQWAEVTSNSLKVPNATQETLEHLKDYIYLQKMPDSGIEQLAALASYFLMSDLEQRCAAKLLFTLCPENAAQFLDFAVKYKIRMLVLAIMEAVHKEVIKVSDIDMLFVKEKKN